MLGTQEILVIALIVLLLFAGKKIPRDMKGLGSVVEDLKTIYPKATFKEAFSIYRHKI